MLASKYLRNKLKKTFLAPNYPVFKKFQEGLSIPNIVEFEKKRPNQTRPLDSITEESVSTILDEYIKMEKRINNFEIDILASRAILFFKHTPITTRQELKIAIENGQLTTHGYDNNTNIYHPFAHLIFIDCCELLGMNSKAELKKVSMSKKRTLKVNKNSQEIKEKRIQDAIALLENEGYQIIRKL